MIRLPARLLPAVQALAELPAGVLLPSTMPVPLALPLFGHRVRAGFTSPADDYVIEVVDGELTVKRLEKRRGKVRLIAEKLAYAPIEFKAGQGVGGLAVLFES